MKTNTCCLWNWNCLQNLTKYHRCQDLFDLGSTKHLLFSWPFMPRVFRHSKHFSYCRIWNFRLRWSMFSFHVNSVSHREKPTENYPPTQLFPSALWSVYGSLNSLLRFNDLQLHCCGLLSPLLYDLASRCGSQPTKPLYASCPITTTSQLARLHSVLCCAYKVA